MLKLTVSIHGNPDRNESDWSETHTISASNITELRKAVLAFQGDNDIGGGNWGEAILHKNDLFVGYVSYNGRVWESPYWLKDAVEVLL